MNPIFTEDHLMIQNMAKDFGKKDIVNIDHEKAFPIEIIRKAGELGFMGMLVPSEYGGSSTDTVGYVVALEELAYASASVSVIISVNNMVCWAIEKYGTDSQKKEFLPDIASGKKLASFALTEANAGSDAAASKMKATKQGNYYILNGTKIFVSSGNSCDLTLTMAVTDPSKDHGFSSFLVTKGTSGFNVGKLEDKMGLRSSDTTEFIFENCKVPVTNMLAKEGDGFKIMMNALNHGRIGIAAQCIGIARACLDEAIKYTENRKQFGKYLTEFQGIQLTLADMATEIEAARALTLHAALLKDKGLPFMKEASMSKLFASEMANRVAYQAVQLHGGYGYMKDYKVERLFRDARVTTIYEGTSEIQRLIIARHILERKG